MATLVPPERPSLLRRLLGQGGHASAAADELPGPIRGELLGEERLGEHARAVARRQRVRIEDRRRSDPTPLLNRLTDTGRLLGAARDTLAAAADAGTDVSPAGEWLLDNFYVLQEHVREVRASMPKGFYRELPKLAVGPLAGYPRVYELAIELIAHTEGRLDPANVSLFVLEFQRGAALTIGELWAVPAMLRLGLIENVRRMTLRTLQRLDEVVVADRWADEFQSASEAGGPLLGRKLDLFVRTHPPLTPAFVSRLLARIRGYQHDFTPLLWLEQWIAEDGLSPEDAVGRSNQRVALTQVMTANSITSLRALTRFDWPSFVEENSLTERTLRTDPTGEYARMTFGTRDHYRHVIEYLAKRTRLPEENVARAAIALAREAADEGRGTRECHVGYWLLEDGRLELERRVEFKPPVRERLHRWVTRHPNTVFFGGFIGGSVLALVGALSLSGARSAPGRPWLALVLLLVPATDAALAFLNQMLTMLLPPRMLPKLEFREDGVPASCRTAVVVPTLLSSIESVHEAFEHLEAQFLANRDPNLHFALLSDFTDADSEHREGDDAIVKAAVARVRELNARYAGGAGTAFYFFHRVRQWNERQGVWMGWERKRGKLAQFNRFLRGADGAFIVVEGEAATIRQCRYVITLDSDTVLPRDAAALLAGTLAHPLNVAVYDAKQMRVTEGYGILQPRVGVNLTSAHRSAFARVHSGHPGVDPYTTAVSDVYQDLFSEGSFTGKGIYDVDAFEQATEGRFPENTLLSHDLIEGAYARAGLVTDIEVYDDYPQRYLTYTRRKHRWIRGDWQLLRWLTPRVPGRHGPERNRLSAISRWKAFDNLRRSTGEIFLVLLLGCGWTVLPGSPARWSATVLALVAFPWIVSLAIALVRPPRDKSWWAYYRAVAGDAVVSLQQLGVAMLTLPHQAWVSADAIARTLNRLLFTHRHLLEWQTASQVERMASAASGQSWRKMAPGVVLAAVLVFAALLAAAVLPPFGLLPRSVQAPIAALLVTWPALALGVLPFALVWLTAPAIMHRLSAPSLPREQRLYADERGHALRYALLHWRFFDRFITEATHGLAPDNFQESPLPVVAMRTSPTNIGLQLLSTATAHDLGFLTAESMAGRLEQAFRSLERMRRFRGHLYNWYDLVTLDVLEPRYVSTVDSGNLAGHLIALAEALDGVADEPVADSRVWRGLQAGLVLATSGLRDLATSGAVADPVGWRKLADAADRARTAATMAGRAAATRVSISSLDEVRRVVREAETAFDGAGIAPEIAGEAGHWLQWSRRLAEEVAGVLESLGLADGDAPPTWREAAVYSQEASELLVRLELLSRRANDDAAAMDFRFLFDERRKLFAIGYHEASRDRDNSFYDLLASEARLASFVAVAKDDVPVEHWFRLGRSLTSAGPGDAMAMVSWSGSMFEYLMPLLVMRSFPGTLLDQTYQGAVRRQIAHGASHSVPWGMSESAYNVRDREGTYQYRAFGVPDLALKRGLGKDLVIAPYASALALLVHPRAAMRNLHLLEDRGALGSYGFRDALDFTRPDPDGRPAVVGNYMAHHVGMSLVAFDNALLGGVWQRRFHQSALARSTELVLFERVPRRIVLAEAQREDDSDGRPAGAGDRPAVREIVTPYTPQPVVALLGMQPYTVMVTNAGGGYSRFEGLAVTRWRADGTRDHTGQFCYAQDVATARVWSAAHQPTGATPDWYRATFATDRAVYHRRDGDWETLTEIAVVPEDAAEVRRVSVTNHGDEPREIELTSYGELVLAPPEADRAHPAFGNLFVETEWLDHHDAVLATRRPRAATERRLWCVHVGAAGREQTGRATCETDRGRFVGRGRSVRAPAVLDEPGPLSGFTGAVLDPVFAVRIRLLVPPRKTARAAFTTIVAESRGRAVELADRYHTIANAQRALDLSWTRTQIELRDLTVTPEESSLYQQVAGHLFYANPAVRAPQHELRANQRGQQDLWLHGISGDWPILLASIGSSAGLPSVRQLLKAHQFWRLKGLSADLIILNTHPPTYLQELSDAVTQTVLSSPESHLLDRPGGVFVRRADIMSADDLLLLRATARVHVQCDGLGLGDLLDTGAGDWAEDSGGEAPVEQAAAAVPHAQRTSGAWLPNEDPGHAPSIGGQVPAAGIRRTARVSGAGLATPAKAAASRGADAVRDGLGALTGTSSESNGDGESAGERYFPGGGAPPQTNDTDSNATDANGDGSATSPLIDSARAAHVTRSATRPLPAVSGAGAVVPPNGYGRLTSRGDYEMIVTPAQPTPAPWCNVIANVEAGFVVTERGGGFMWAGNSYFFRLTPWANDPVSDPPGDAIYLQDIDSGELWSPTPAPIPGTGAYTVRHAPGVTTFEHTHGAVHTRLELTMAGEDPVRLSRLTISNSSSTAPLRLRITSYAEWTLGVMREHTQHQVHTRYNRTLGALLAQNPFDAAWRDRTAFAAMSEPVTTFTADRREFLGRHGSIDRPAALLRTQGLSETVGAGFDPCTALQCEITVAPGQTREVVVILGAAKGAEAVASLVRRYQQVKVADEVATASVAVWERRLSAITISTPDPEFDALCNRWTPYQALACRMWARSALYQSSGAYGFRDQLQDTMAFVYAEPAIARAHIVRSAARQFVEGDVQHWWHPDTGRGVRTKFSDDLAWLPYVVDHYVRVTGDSSVLEEQAQYLTMRALGEHEHEIYDLPQPSGTVGSVYEHCVRALDRACTAGAHGLPLIGIGDWNDGMNRVGHAGRGESVWLAWFLIVTLRRFATHSRERDDDATAERFAARADAYARACDEHAWDGAWYRRAYFDDGTPLGSSINDECSIDAIAQSWSVLSAAGDPSRRVQAMESMERHLVDERLRLIRLLTPSFDVSPLDPGYIKGYLPGVRENGAQYTHAALWAVLAAVAIGDGDKAYRWFTMLNPFTHARTREEADRYKVEPYVIAADVYTAEGQEGRGGWTWYTGSASWAYRVMLEGILGFTKRGQQLTFVPCIPRAWHSFALEYRYGETIYAVEFRNPDGITSGVRTVTVDGVPVEDNIVLLADDGGRRDLVVLMGTRREDER